MALKNEAFFAGTINFPQTFADIILNRGYGVEQLFSGGGEDAKREKAKAEIVLFEPDYDRKD